MWNLKKNDIYMSFRQLEGRSKVLPESFGP